MVGHAMHKNRMALKAHPFDHRVRRGDNMHATPTETHKAQKKHRCEWCWQFIEVGETYKRYRFYADGDVSTVKMHPECYEVMQDEASNEGGWLEWTPGQERPAPSNARAEPRTEGASVSGALLGDKGQRP